MKYLALLLFLPFTVHAQCTLPQVTSFDVTNVTSTSADLHWVTTGDQMNIQYIRDDMEVKNTVGPSTAGASLIQLVPNSVYTFRIQPFNDCGTGDWTTVVKSTPPLAVGGITKLPRTGNDQSDSRTGMWIALGIMAGVGYLLIRNARRM